MKRSGVFKEVIGLYYKAFEPTKLQLIELNIDNDILALLGEANLLLGKLDGLSINIPDKALFVASYVRKEAILSSQIEGTQTSLEDILSPTVDSSKNLDVIDVVKYIEALNYALKRLEDLPLSNRLIKEIHAILLDSTRGKDKNPGEFRKSQNWIGGTSSSLKTARFIPPTVDYMHGAMSDLEKFIHEQNDLDGLIKVALTHYQFETIHPFLDGNGRIGRMLIILQLIHEKKIQNAVLYISYFLKINRVEYYDRLEEVRRKDDYKGWVKFFLKAIIEGSKDSIETILLLGRLKKENDLKIVKESKSVRRVYVYIQSFPIIQINKTSNALKLTFKTIGKAVERLIQLNVLGQADDNKRDRVFEYKAYLDILRKNTENL